MKDEDSQQQNETLQALTDVFPNTIEGTCEWHIGESILGQKLSTCNMSISQYYYPFTYFMTVNQGWKMHVGRSPVSPLGMDR